MESKEIPVLVGVGVATQRIEDPTLAREPIELILEAVRAAGTDCGQPAALSGTQWIGVPRGRWSYRNPAGRIARSVHAAHAETTLAYVGVQQQTLIGEACRRIAEGEADITLVAGGEAGYRLQRYAAAGLAAPESQDEDEPHRVLRPQQELRHPAELRAGLTMPVGLYAMVDSAFRHRMQRELNAHRHDVDSLYARLTEIAAANPQAWDRRQRDVQAFAASADNAMHALPYTKRHCSNWSVDQASALLFMSQRKAESLGVARDRWVFPLASTEANHMVPVSARAALGACPGAVIAGHEALQGAGVRAQALDFVDLYSCFPIALLLYAQALGLQQGRDLSVTGGMPFGGGPYNNYVLQSTARMAQLLREHGGTGLTSSVSGIVTKQGFGIWSSHAPGRPFHWADVTSRVAKEVEVREVVQGVEGLGRIAGYTVLGSKNSPATGIAIVDLRDGRRAVAVSTDEPLLALLQSTERVGAPVQLMAGDRFCLAP